ncbi:MAG TPA: hypothetical protein VKW76_09465 [Candidatus Binatia bacterium]|nr:hypothetical protein [Candidatus Binatia bacterium]
MNFPLAVMPSNSAKQSVFFDPPPETVAHPGLAAPSARGNAKRVVQTIRIDMVVSFLFMGRA